MAVVGGGGGGLQNSEVKIVVYADSEALGNLSPSWRWGLFKKKEWERGVVQDSEVKIVVCASLWFWGTS